MYRSLFFLSAGAFAIGTNGFVIAGVLPIIGGDLGVSVSIAGQLVAIFSIAYALSSPILAITTSRQGPKTIVAIALGVFALATLAASGAPNYATLAAARIVQAMAAGTFMPAASGYAASIAPARWKGRALTFISLGTSVATLLGVPIGTVMGTQFGWRITFVAIAVSAGAALVGILLFLPALPGKAEAQLAERFAVARRGDVLLVLLLTVLVTIGAFTVYTYISPFLQRVAGFSGPQVAGVLLIFGLGGAIGNIAGGVACDRWGPRPILAVALLVIAGSFSILSLATVTFTGLTAGLVVSAAMGIWGAFGWSYQAAQQMRLVALEPRHSAIVLSLNSSATFLAISFGAVLGGVLVANDAVTSIGWVGAGCVVLGMVVLWACPDRSKTHGEDVKASIDARTTGGHGLRVG